MILTKALCWFGWHDKIRADTYYFNEQGRVVLATVIRCHDCDYHRMTETFVDQESRPKSSPDRWSDGGSPPGGP